MTNLLIIGYGNLLRGDDGAGRLVADEVSALGIPGVVVQSRHQLVPELVEDMKAAANVLFVDATAIDGALKLRRITAHPRRQALVHACAPGGLLALSQAIYGRYPKSWLLTIPGDYFGMTEKLSPMARANMAKAVLLIRRWQGCG